MDFLNRVFRQKESIMLQQQILPATRIPFCAIERPIQQGEPLVIEKSSYNCPDTTTIFCPDGFDVQQDFEFTIGCEWLKDEAIPSDTPEPLCAPQEKRIVFKDCAENEIRTELCKNKEPCSITDSNCVCADSSKIIGVVCSPYIPESTKEISGKIDCGLYGTNYKLACPEEYTLDEIQGLCMYDPDKAKIARIKKNKIIGGEERTEESSEIPMEVIPLKVDVVVRAPEDSGTVSEEVELPVEEIPEPEVTEAPVEEIPVGEIPVEEIPVEEIPVEVTEAPVDEIPAQVPEIFPDEERSFDGQKYVPPQLNLAVELERPMTKLDLRKSQFCPMDSYYSCSIPSL